MIIIVSIMIIIVNNIIIIMIIIINIIINITIISLLCSLTNDRTIKLLRENDKPEEMVGLLKRVEEDAVLVEEVCPIGGRL